MLEVRLEEEIVLFMLYFQAIQIIVPDLGVSHSSV